MVEKTSNAVRHKELDKLREDCQLTLLEMYYSVNAGHIGSSLSCLDILIYLYFSEMNEDDGFVLSKGHAAAALYTVINKAGAISDEELKTYYQDGTYLAAHPPCGAGKVKGITFGTGSLGHGLSLATGMALAKSLHSKTARTYTVVSDGDCNEGSTWEAAMFASHHNLKNLVVIVDNNELQGFGRTKDVIDMGSMPDKWRSFGFEVFEVANGNDFGDLAAAFKQINASKSDQPKCIVARTTKGSGVSFMEHSLDWHYLPMNDEQYQQAISEVTRPSLSEVVG